MDFDLASSTIAAVREFIDRQTSRGDLKGLALKVGSQRLSAVEGPDPITSPDFVVIKAADEFQDKTTAPNQLWQTDFTYLQGDWLGLILSVDDPVRLLPHRHRLKAVQGR